MNGGAGVPPAAIAGGTPAPPEDTMKRLLLVLLPLLLLAWGVTCLYPVDYTEYAYVTRFGQPVAVIDGGTDAGPHVKLPWPVDAVARIDRRVQSFDLPPVEALTRDPARGTIDKTLTADVSVTWRVPDAAAADLFVRAAGSPERVKTLLAPRVSGRLAAVIGGMSLDELVSVPAGGEAARQAAADRRAAAFEEKLLADDFTVEVRTQYGVEIVSLRLRRLTFPEAVRASIYERIRAERAIKVAEYENEGRREASRIGAEADRKRREIEAAAKAEKQRIEGEADVTADALRNAAHAKDPEFYAFLQRLKAMQAVLADSRGRAPALAQPRAVPAAEGTAQAAERGEVAVRRLPYILPVLPVLAYLATGVTTVGPDERAVGAAVRQGGGPAPAPACTSGCRGASTGWTSSPSAPSANSPSGTRRTTRPTRPPCPPASCSPAIRTSSTCGWWWSTPSTTSGSRSTP